MKLRLLPVVISVVVSSAVLFGGWFAYHSVAMESPLSDAVEQIAGVENVSVTVDQDLVHIDLELAPDADLHAITSEIRKAGKDALEGRELDLRVKNESSNEIDKWWSLVLFDIAEAMEQRQYASIPQVLDSRMSELPGLATEAAIDEDFVYIRLTHGESSKFVVLPRIPVQMGVWPNE